MCVCVCGHGGHGGFVGLWVCRGCGVLAVGVEGVDVEVYIQSK